MDKAGLEADKRPAVVQFFRDAATRAVKHFDIQFDEDGEPVSYTDDKVIFKAVRN